MLFAPANWENAVISRLISGKRNRHNFFVRPIFYFKKIGTESVNHPDSGDINILVQFPGNLILKFSSNF